MKLFHRPAHDRWFVWVPDDTDIELLHEAKGIERPVTFTVSLDVDGQYVWGYFTLNPMPGNCGIVVSTQTAIGMKYRGQRRAKDLHDAKEVVSKNLGYSAMLSTTVADNVPQVVSASKKGWRFLDTFVNSRTNNTCLVGFKKLN